MPLTTSDVVLETKVLVLRCLKQTKNKVLVLVLVLTKKVLRIFKTFMGLTIAGTKNNNLGRD